VTVDDVTRRERTISGALALAMHALFLVLLVVGISWQPKRSTAPIAVELWSELPTSARPAPEPPPPPPPEPVLKQAPRPEPRPEPKPEFKPAPDPQIAIQEKLEKERRRKEREAEELEKKRIEENKRAEEKKREEVKRLAEEKKRVEEKKREEAKKLAEQKKREEERKLAALKAQEDAKRKEQELQAMLQKQQAQQAADTAARAQLDTYRHVVSEKIKRYIVMPPNIQGNPEAVFEVVQIPGGEILSVKLKRSSGNPAYDAAVERAIHKASPLPPPPNGVRFGDVREFEAKFRPKE
jgi:colicin import membrane protein